MLAKILVKIVSGAGLNNTDKYLIEKYQEWKKLQILVITLSRHL